MSPILPRVEDARRLGSLSKSLYRRIIRNHQLSLAKARRESVSSDDSKMVGYSPISPVLMDLVSLPRL